MLGRVLSDIYTQGIELPNVTYLVICQAVKYMYQGERVYPWLSPLVMWDKNVSKVKTVVLLILVFIFICPFENRGRIMGTRAAGGGVQSICPLNNLNSFHCIIIKLCENVYWQNISAKFIFQWIIKKLGGNVCWLNPLAKFNNQPDPMKFSGVTALELTQI